MTIHRGESYGGGSSPGCELGCIVVGGVIVVGVVFFLMNLVYKWVDLQGAMAPMQVLGAQMGPAIAQFVGALPPARA